MGCVEDPYRIFPKWLSVVLSLAPVLLALVVAIQRDALVPPRGPALVAAVAALPWLVELFGLRPVRWSAATAQLVYAAVVLAAVSVLLLSPVQVDAAPFFLVYLAATASVLAPTWASVVITAASVAVLVTLDIADQFNDVFVWVLGIIFAWAAGAAVARQERLIDELRAAQAQLAARAAADERQRIAREIHDVIAHSLAVRMPKRRSSERSSSAGRAWRRSGARLGSSGTKQPRSRRHCRVRPTSCRSFASSRPPGWSSISRCRAMPTRWRRAPAWASTGSRKSHSRT